MPEKCSHVDEWASLLDEHVPEEALAEDARRKRRIDPLTPRRGN